MPAASLSPSDPMGMLDMKQRTGVSDGDIEKFISKVDLVTKAIEEIKDGNFDPNTCKIPGFKTDQQIQEEQKQLQIRKEQQIQRQLKAKNDEKSEWWRRAHLKFDIDEEEEKSNQQNGDQNTQKRSAILRAYQSRDANDYSSWQKWEPKDPVTLEEKAEQEAILEKRRNDAFEQNNPEFCTQFKEDMEKRNKSRLDELKKAQKFKEKGNKYFKSKMYKDAIICYMNGLEKASFDEFILTNIAQSYLRLKEYDDSIEFSTRALYVNPKHVKAFSRRSAAEFAKGNYETAFKDIEEAVKIDPENLDLNAEYKKIHAFLEDSQAEEKLQSKIKVNKSLEEFNNIVTAFVKEDVSPDWMKLQYLLNFNGKDAQILFRTSGSLLLACRKAMSYGCFSKASSEDQKTVMQILSCLTCAVTGNFENQEILASNKFSWLISKILLNNLPNKEDVQFEALLFLKEVLDCSKWHEEILNFSKKKTKKEHDTKLSPILVSVISSLCFENVCGREIGSEIILSLTAKSKGQKNLAGFEKSFLFQRMVENLCLEKKSALRKKAIRENIIGIMLNLSSVEASRFQINSCSNEELRQMLVFSLLDCLKSVESDSLESRERALAVLLNYSINKDSKIRDDIVSNDGIPLLLSCVEERESLSHQPKLIINDRSSSLICRILGKLTPSAFELLSCEKTASILLNILKKRFSLCTIDNGNCKIMENILFIFGYCLKEKYFQLTLLKLKGMEFFFDLLMASKENEMLIANLVKCLIAMFPHLPQGNLLHSHPNAMGIIKQLVTLLMEMQNKTARKNVAILLAKLCKSDDAIRQIVKELKGIQVMLQICKEIN